MYRTSGPPCLPSALLVTCGVLAALGLIAARDAVAGEGDELISNGSFNEVMPAVEYDNGTPYWRPVGLDSTGEFSQIKNWYWGGISIAEVGGDGASLGGWSLSYPDLGWEHRYDDEYWPKHFELFGLFGMTYASSGPGELGVVLHFRQNTYTAAQTIDSDDAAHFTVLELEYDWGALFHSSATFDVWLNDDLLASHSGDPLTGDYECAPPGQGVPVGEDYDDPEICRFGYNDWTAEHWGDPILWPMRHETRRIELSPDDAPPYTVKFVDTYTNDDWRHMILSNVSVTAKIAICHKGGTIEVRYAQDTMDDHLGHGDSLGACP